MPGDHSKRHMTAGILSLHHDGGRSHASCMGVGRQTTPVRGCGRLESMDVLWTLYGRPRLRSNYNIDVVGSAFTYYSLSVIMRLIQW